MCSLIEGRPPTAAESTCDYQAPCRLEKSTMFQVPCPHQNSVLRISIEDEAQIKWMGCSMGGVRVHHAHGASSLVFKARWRNVLVAVKQIHKHLRVGEAVKRDFRNEVEYLYRLNHPYITRVFGADFSECASIQEFLPLSLAKLTPIFMKIWGRAGGGWGSEPKGGHACDG